MLNFALLLPFDDAATTRPCGYGLLFCLRPPIAVEDPKGLCRPIDKDALLCLSTPGHQDNEKPLNFLEQLSESAKPFLDQRTRPQTSGGASAHHPT